MTSAQKYDKVKSDKAKQERIETMYNARKDAQRAKRRARRLDALTPAQLTVIYTRIRSRLSSDHTYAFGWHWTELQRRNPATAKILRAVIAAYNRQTMPVQDRA